ncbi:MAG: metallophosphoesterase [Pseudomonadota bacterium]
MFTLAHISDVHLSPLPDPSISQLASKRLFGYINWQRNRKKALGSDFLTHLMAHMGAQNPDQILVSGDLVNLALPAEYTNARRFLHTLGKPEDVFALCGNHDAYVKGGIENAIASWGEYLTGDTHQISNTDEYPQLRVRGDIALIGCNSAEPTLPLMATGYFREPQALKLASILEQTKDKTRIVAIHHPPIEGATRNFKRLIGCELFQSVIKSHGCDLILHGHTHLATRYFLDGPEKPIPVICVPAAGNAPGGKRPCGRYNLFKIECSNAGALITQQEWGWDGPSQIELLSETAL